MSRNECEELFYKEESKILAQLGISDDRASVDFLNPEHFSLLQKQPTYSKILAFYKELYPDNENLFARIHALPYLIHPLQDSSLPGEQELLDRIPKDLEMVRGFKFVEQSAKNVLCELIELIQARTIAEQKIDWDELIAKVFNK
jgi:hypothetical protein